MKSFRGRVWKLGDDVNTDQIIAGKYLDNYAPSHLATHALEGIRKDFSAGVRAGDIILAGRNFGCGSSREQAVMALQHSGIAAIVAQSFSRIFYRNAVNLGMYPIVSQEAHGMFREGEVAIIDLGSHVITSQDGSTRASIEEIPERVREILESGGLVSHLKTRLKRSKTKT